MSQPVDPYSSSTRRENHEDDILAPISSHGSSFAESTSHEGMDPAFDKEAHKQREELAAARAAQTAKSRENSGSSSSAPAYPSLGAAVGIRTGASAASAPSAASAASTASSLLQDVSTSQSLRSDATTRRGDSSGSITRVPVWERVGGENASAGELGDSRTGWERVGGENSPVPTATDSREASPTSPYSAQVPADSSYPASSLAPLSESTTDSSTAETSSTPHSFPDGTTIVSDPPSTGSWAQTEDSATTWGSTPEIWGEESHVPHTEEKNLDLPTIPGRGWAHTLSLLFTLLLTPLAWYILSDASIRLGLVAGNPWESGALNFAALGELIGGLAITGVIWAIARTSSLGAHIVGWIVSIAGVAALLTPTFTQKNILTPLEDSIGNFNNFTANLVHHLNLDLASGRIFIFGMLLVFTAFVSHTARKRGETSGALLARRDTVAGKREARHTTTAHTREAGESTH